MARFGSRWVVVVLLAMAFQFLGGCASGPNAADPWEKSNRVIYDFNDGMDRAILKPLADGYVKVVPKEIRTGLNNGFNNLNYFDVILNDFLQAKWEQGWRDSGRMAVNSTVGILGMLDPATPLGMPSHENDFGITLGKWGVQPGPYIVLPLFGPSTGRDVPGILVGIADNPLTYVDMKWYVSFAVSAVQAVDARASMEGLFKFRQVASIDSYVFMREAYLSYRMDKIREGKEGPASTQPSMYDEDDDAPATRAATRPVGTQPTTLPTR